MINIPPLYPIIRGASLELFLNVKSGTVVGDELIRCVGKAALSEIGPPPGDNAEEAFVMETVFEAAAGGRPNRWALTLTDEVSETLAPGFYAVDARIPLAGGSVKYFPFWVIEVQERVTVAAA